MKEGKDKASDKKEEYKKEGETNQKQFNKKIKQIVNFPKVKKLL